MDLKLDPNGDIYERPRYVDGPEFVRQRIENRLRSHVGEYILDTRQGLPYKVWLAQKPVNLGEIGDRVRLEIETTPGVDRILNFEATYDSGEISITGTIRLETDERVELTSFIDPTEPGITRVRIAS